jgi:hypothetical protein
MVTNLKFKHWFDCRNGKLIFNERKAYRTDVSHFQGRRGYIVFYDEAEDKPVSKESRAWYFKVLIGELSHLNMFFAMSPLDIHHELMKFFWGEMIECEGTFEIQYPSLTSMNAKQWHQHTELTELFAEMHGCTIKPVNTYKFD